MISFFAKEPFILYKPSGPTLQRVSSIIRAKEIATFLGAKLNPKQGFENDVCVHVKPRKMELVRDIDYVDVLDDAVITERLKARPNVNVIAITSQHRDWLASFLPNKIALIPHHHVNFERKKRTRKKVITCGYVGANEPFQRRFANDLARRLSREGIKFIPFFTFQNRENILSFYDNIDIQVISSFGYLTDTPYYHPTKIVNAMSFGIPTVASEKLGYKDVEDFYIKANSMDELVAEVKKLQDQKEYDKWPEKLIAEAEKYHIENISKLYQQL